jgi:dTDP-glucose 4,6-dehydratase
MQILLKSDLDLIYAKAKDEFAALAGKKIFITGGTGFFGKWLLYAFAYANKKLQSPVTISVLSRNPQQFLVNHPDFRENQQIQFITGDITDFVFPDDCYDYIIHAATEASDKLNRESPELMLNTTINGTKRLLEFAKKCKSDRVLLTSSGAVYGKQPIEVDRTPEDFLGGPNILDVNAAYAEGKRVSELLGAIHAKQSGQSVLIARCFAFVGPFLPIDTHFAIGNFINDCLNNRDIIIKGDGTPHRSYLYAADLVIWLLKILVHGESLRAYNVGSEKSLSIKEIAESVLAVWNECPDLQKYRKNKLKFEILSPPKGGSLEKFVPSTQRISAELGVCESLSLQDAILKTFLFHLHK